VGLRTDDHRIRKQRLPDHRGRRGRLRRPEHERLRPEPRGQRALDLCDDELHHVLPSDRRHGRSRDRRAGGVVSAIARSQHLQDLGHAHRSRREQPARGRRRRAVWAGRCRADGDLRRIRQL
jgi:hypothetical protein